MNILPLLPILVYVPIAIFSAVALICLAMAAWVEMTKNAGAVAAVSKSPAPVVTLFNARARTLNRAGAWPVNQRFSPLKA